MRFLAVHGGCHGAWCWDLLRPELEALGHELVAPDLPGHGSRIGEVATLEGYREAVLDVLIPGDVLVGHSSGAVVAILAANERPNDIAHLCLLAGILPVDGKPLPYETTSSNLGGGTDGRPSDDTATLDTHMSLTEDGSAFYFSRTGAVMSFYSDCTDELADWAYQRLVPEPLSPLSVPVHVPNFWQSDIPRSFIMCRQDPICFPDLALSQARRLGVVPLEIDSAHSPFLSRPRELASLLVAATTAEPVGPLIPYSLSDSAAEAS